MRMPAAGVARLPGATIKAVVEVMAAIQNYGLQLALPLLQQPYCASVKREELAHTSLILRFHSESSGKFYVSKSFVCNRN